MKSRVGVYVSGLLVLMSALVVGCGGTDDPPDNPVPSGNFRAPQAPTAVVVTPGDGQLSVSWTAPTSNGGKDISGYTVRALEAQTVRGEAKAAPGATSATVTGLTNGVSYTVTVSAENEVGATASTPSEAAVPRKVLGAPRDVQATPGNKQVVVSWTPPEATGLAVTGYTVTVRSGETDVTTKQSTEPTVTVTELANGTPYTFTVMATNPDGAGPTAAPVTTTPRTVPGAPNRGGTPFNEKIRVDWVAPKDNGGSPILSYRIFFTLEATGETREIDVPATVREYYVTGLKNGEVCRYSVAAINAAGMGPRSSEARTWPVTTPTAPRNFTGHSEVDQVRFTWDLPESDGYAEITYCLISFDYAPDQPERVYLPTTEWSASLPASPGVVFNATLVCPNGQGPSPAVTATATTL